MVLNMPGCNVTKLFFILILVVACASMVRFVSLVNFQLKKVSSGQCVFSKENLTDGEGAYIPHHIHQIFFGVDQPMPPQRFRDAALTWRRKNPQFQYTLWNKSMVDDLINVNYPEIRELYDGYDHWVKRADVARYLILYHHGGVYVDMDIKCRVDITGFLATMTSEKRVGAYRTKPIGVSNDFLIARTRNKFIRSVVCGLWESNRYYFVPYLTVLMSTGPLYLSERLSAYEYKDEVFLMEESFLSQYIEHIKGATWHQLDGKVIWWVFVHAKVVSKSAVGVLLLMLIYKIYSVTRCILERRRKKTKNFSKIV